MTARRRGRSCTPAILPPQSDDERGHARQPNWNGLCVAGRDRVRVPERLRRSARRSLKIPTLCGLRPPLDSGVRSRVDTGTERRWQLAPVLEDMPRAEPLTIGELAAEAGMSPDALRYYERRGLIAPTRRTAGGFRVYPSEVIDRLRFIKQAKQNGLTLREIHE